MDFTAMVELLSNMEADFSVHPRKHVDVDPPGDYKDIVLIINHKDGTSTVSLYDLDGRYIKTL